MCARSLGRFASGPRAIRFPTRMLLLPAATSTTPKPNDTTLSNDICVFLHLSTTAHYLCVALAARKTRETIQLMAVDVMLEGGCRERH